MERTWRNFRRRRCCALCPGYEFCSPGKRSATGETYRHAGRTTETQKPIRQDGLFTCLMPRQFPTLTWGDPTLPSALRRFTSEFGMGSGGTTALVPPGQILCARPVSFALILRWLLSRVSVTYLCMLLPSRRLPPCLSAKSFGL